MQNEPVFPQADNLKLLLKILIFIDSEGVKINQVSNHVLINERNSRYYLDALLYLDLVEKIKIKYFLNEKGIEMQQLYVRLGAKPVYNHIISHRYLRHLYEIYKSNLSYDNKITVLVEKLMNDYHLSQSTATRRLSCIMSWFEQIQEVIIKPETVFNELNKVKKRNQDVYSSHSETIVGFFRRCKSELGYIPSRIEFYNSLSSTEYKYVKNNINNPFKNYYEFLRNTDSSFKLYINPQTQKFIEMIEQTSLNRLYKIPIFLAFLNDGKFRYEVSKNNVILSFRKFYNDQRNFLDIQNIKSRSRFPEYFDNEVWNMAENNPIRFLCLSYPDIFKSRKDGIKIIIDLGSDIEKTEIIDFIRDAIEFRRYEFIDLRLSKIDK
jgi:predicted transcriptional regulator